MEKWEAAIVAGETATESGEWTENREAAAMGEAAVDVGEVE